MCFPSNLLRNLLGIIDVRFNFVRTQWRQSPINLLLLLLPFFYLFFFGKRWCFQASQICLNEIENLFAVYDSELCRILFFLFLLLFLVFCVIFDALQRRMSVKINSELLFHSSAHFRPCFCILRLCYLIFCARLVNTTPALQLNEKQEQAEKAIKACFCSVDRSIMRTNYWWQIEAQFVVVQIKAFLFVESSLGFVKLSKIWSRCFRILTNNPRHLPSRVQCSSGSFELC